MEIGELREKIEEHLKGLRKADTQPTAIAWMKTAYTLLEQCSEELKFKQAVKASRIYIPERPQIEVFSAIPKPGPAQPRPIWLAGQTVVYPEVPMPPARPISQPKPWTHKDTLRLERTVQRKGK